MLSIGNYTSIDVCTCPANNYTGGKCQPGSFCPEGSSAPTSCTAGMYCDDYELATPKGKYCFYKRNKKIVGGSLDSITVFVNKIFV